MADARKRGSMTAVTMTIAATKHCTGITVLEIRILTLTADAGVSAVAGLTRNRRGV
jgi:hypothetical protein